MLQINEQWEYTHQFIPVVCMAVNYNTCLDRSP